MTLVPDEFGVMRRCEKCSREFESDALVECGDPECPLREGLDLGVVDGDRTLIDPNFDRAAVLRAAAELAAQQGGDLTVLDEPQSSATRSYDDMAEEPRDATVLDESPPESTREHDDAPEETTRPHSATGSFDADTASFEEPDEATVELAQIDRILLMGQTGGDETIQMDAELEAELLGPANATAPAEPGDDDVTMLAEPSEPGNAVARDDDVTLLAESSEPGDEAASDAAEKLHFDDAEPQADVLADPDTLSPSEESVASADTEEKGENYGDAPDSTVKFDPDEVAAAAAEHVRDDDDDDVDATRKQPVVRPKLSLADLRASLTHKTGKRERVTTPSAQLKPVPTLDEPITEADDDEDDADVDHTMKLSAEEIGIVEATSPSMDEPRESTMQLSHEEMLDMVVDELPMQSDPTVQQAAMQRPLPSLDELGDDTQQRPRPEFDELQAAAAAAQIEMTPAPDPMGGYAKQGPPIANPTVPVHQQPLPPVPMEPVPMEPMHMAPMPMDPMSYQGPTGTPEGWRGRIKWEMAVLIGIVLLAVIGAILAIAAY